jgi:hypothetical protein
MSECRSAHPESGYNRVFPLLVASDPSDWAEPVIQEEALVARHDDWGAFAAINALTCEFADPIIVAQQCMRLTLRRLQDAKRGPPV